MVSSETRENMGMNDRIAVKIDTSQHHCELLMHAYVPQYACRCV